MLTVHHLNNSRSQRVLWLLEELGVALRDRPLSAPAGHARARGIARDSSARKIPGRIHARPAYIRALEKGGPYTVGADSAQLSFAL